MTGAARYVARNDLARTLGELARGRCVHAPRREGGVVVFRPWAEGDELLLARATAPPKGVLFPQSESLFGFTREKDPDNPGLATLRLDAALPEAPAFIFGCRPCDARGLAVFDRVYLNGRYRDPYYAARREATIVATLACLRPGATCFCHWVGGGPADVAGSDLLLTDCGEGYVAQAVTERGAALLESTGLPAAGRWEEAAQEVQAAARAALDAASPAPDLTATPARLRERFADSDFWRDMSDACLSCRACTFLCPTCSCFNITDENSGGDGLGGRRLRTWDSCMSPLFTREAGGHNPRMDKALRLRNRVGHKFSYYPRLHGGAVACSGCGRCIIHCPASVDIRRIVLAATRRDPAKENHNA